MEIYDLYDENRVLTGLTNQRGNPLPPMQYKVMVFICIFNYDGQMLIQQRQNTKISFPNKWEFSTTGGLVSGETSKQGATREVYEELGILVDLKRPIITLNVDKGYIDVYTIKQNVPLDQLQLQESEVKDAKYATKEEILNLIEKDEFVPYRKELVELLFSCKDSRKIYV